MKIGLIHHYYEKSIPSGENLSVNNILDIMSKNNEVSVWSDQTILSQSKLSLFNLVYLFRHFIYDYRNKEFKKWVQDQDGIQIHNNFPLLTLTNIWTLRKASNKIPIFRVVHNYRLSCLKGTHIRNSSHCFKCGVENFSPGIIRACYKSSFLLSLLVSINTKLLRYVIEVSKKSSYIAISSNISEYLSPFTKKEIILIKHFIDVKDEQISPSASDALYLGRLDPEKNVKKFLQAWLNLLDEGYIMPVLHVIGTGSQSNDCREICSVYPQKIIFYGHLTGRDLEEVRKQCKLFVFTSLWKEPFGRSVMEAAAYGMFIIGNRSPLAETLIEQGINGAFLEDDYKNLFDCITFGLKSDLESHINVSKQKFIYENGISTPEIWEKAYRKYQFPGSD